MTTNPVLIIGAGIAGLSAAQRLAAANIPAIVLDKGRGVGGRMATRRVGEAVFDHGAQFFSAKTDDFQRFLSGAVEHGATKEWRPALTDTRYPRWVGTSGMNAVPKQLAETCTVHKAKKVVKFELTGDAWRVITDESDSYLASALLVTIPAPQALELLENSNIHLPDNPLWQIRYHPCLAVLATLNGTTSIPAPGGLPVNGEVVTWLADNFQKGISRIPSVTIHASPDFSKKYLDGDLQTAGNLMLEDVAEYLKPALVLDWQIHRWRYSLAYERYPAPCFPAQTAVPLLFGGDGFGMGNVEGAYLSGLAMADLLVGN